MVVIERNIGTPYQQRQNQNQQPEKLPGESQGRTVTILTDPSMHTTTIQRHELNVPPHLTDLFTLKLEEFRAILHMINDKFMEIESSERPAAGYEVHFKVVGKGKRPIEVALDACGERNVGQDMEMPQIKGNSGCAMCKNTEQMSGYEEAATPLARVIQSLEGNPLTISVLHSKHFFEMSLEGQSDMLISASKVLQIYTQEKCSRYTISAHVGTAGHQTFPHAHLHASASLGLK